MSAINFHISQTDWIKYIKTMSANVKISRVCPKVIPIKMFFKTWHGSNPTSYAFSCYLRVFRDYFRFRFLLLRGFIWRVSSELNSYSHLLHWSEDITPKHLYTALFSLFLNCYLSCLLQTFFLFLLGCSSNTCSTVSASLCI